MFPPRPTDHIDPAMVISTVIVYGGMILFLGLALIGAVHIWKRL